MKQLLSLLLLTHLLIANNQFSKEEQSVFSSTQEQQIQDKEIVTYEQNELVSNEPIQEETFSPTTLNDDLNTNLQEETLPKDTLKPSNENATMKLFQNMMQNSTDDETMSILTDEMNISLDKKIKEEPEAKDYFTKVEFDNGTRAKSLYLSYPYYPKKVYKNQRFEIAVKALVTTDDFYKIETRFVDGKNMIPLNPQSVWILQENNTFENRYYFKAYDEDFVMPSIQVLLYQNDQIIESQIISPEMLEMTEIGKDDERFSSVIAKGFKVNAYKTKQYNNNELITILDVQAYESNLEDFHIRNIEEQGFSKISDEYPEQKMLYYLVLPIHNKKIVFNYYNTAQKKFTTITIPVILENELISTQTDLNPNNSNMLFYKKVALSILCAVFLLLFAWKRRYIYLIALLLSLIILLVYVMPNKQAFVKNNTTIYILPTNNSTIFYKTKKVNVVQVDMKKENFVKIIMNINNKKIIGWIKEEQLVEN